MCVAVSAGGGSGGAVTPQLGTTDIYWKISSGSWHFMLALIPETSHPQGSIGSPALL